MFDIVFYFFFIIVIVSAWLAVSLIRIYLSNHIWFIIIVIMNSKTKNTHEITEKTKLWEEGRSVSKQKTYNYNIDFSNSKTLSVLQKLLMASRNINSTEIGKAFLTHLRNYIEFLENNSFTLLQAGK